MSTLTVDFPYYGPAAIRSITSLCKILLQQSSRICRMEFIWSPESRELLNLLPKSLPCLESLTLDVCFPSYRPYYPVYDFPTPLKLPSDSFCEMGRIRCLKITGVAINWKSHLYNTLTELKLYDIPHDCLPTSTQFWNAMKNMPLLQILSFRDVFPFVAVATPFIEKTHFHHLQKLSISATMGQVQMFLEGVAFSPTTILIVTCYVQEEVSNFFAYHAILSSMAPAIEANKRSLKLDITLPFLSTGNSGMQIDAFNCPGLELHNVEFHRDPPNPFLSFSVERLSPIQTSFERVLVDFFRELPLNETTQMRIRDTTSNHLSSQMILETFGNLPKLESLATRLRSDYLVALQTTLPCSTPSNFPHPLQSTPSFPSLRALTIVDIDFDVDIRVTDRTISTEGLLDCLKWRSEHGVQLQNLQIKACTRISRSHISSIREVVVDVDWDGVEEGFTDDEEEMDPEHRYTFYHGPADNPLSRHHNPTRFICIMDPKQDLRNNF